MQFAAEEISERVENSRKIERIPAVIIIRVKKTDYFLEGDRNIEVLSVINIFIKKLGIRIVINIIIIIFLLMLITLKPNIKLTK